MFNVIHKNDKNNSYSNCFVNQCLQKKRLMKMFLENVNENIKSILGDLGLEDNYNINNIDDDSNIMKDIVELKIKVINKINLNNLDLENVSQNVFEYFKDFGISFLFEIECEKSDLLIKIKNFANKIIN